MSTATYPSSMAKQSESTNGASTVVAQPSPPPPPVKAISPSKMTATIRQVTEQPAGATPLKVSTSNSKGSKPSSRTPSKSPPSKIPPSNRLRGSPASPVTDAPPPLPPRPRSRRSSSQEKHFFAKIKKGRDQIQADGLKAATFLGKVGHQTWDKIKSQRLAAKHSGMVHGRSASPQAGLRENPGRDTSNDIDVFGMNLKEAVTKTRIVKERKQEGDAAYWMPALAYRCLQYLNVYGPHEIGIYRIPGSTAVVDELRADFKIQHDVDLFEQPPDDLHTVSSLLKAWFRSLPDGILPQDVQVRIYEKCRDDTESPTPPKAFIEELSRLPPYNYYLLNYLFSHLSAVCLASDVNKMNLANLGMIFCSTLRIDRFCFNWLVGSWSECWAGCETEEDEYERLQNASMPPSRNGNCEPVPRAPSRAQSDRHAEQQRENQLQQEKDQEKEKEQEKAKRVRIAVEEKVEKPAAHLEVKSSSKPGDKSPSIYSQETDDDRTMSMYVETGRGSMASDDSHASMDAHNRESILLPIQQPDRI